MYASSFGEVFSPRPLIVQGILFRKGAELGVDLIVISEIEEELK
ncbi:MAG: hypothetical protein ACE5HY_01535 [Candidatus Hydrothermarchaeales archaeon]